MRRTILLAAAATIGLAVTGTAADPVQPANGLKFSIAADKLEFKPGEPVTITMTLENTSAGKLRVLRYEAPRWDLTAPDSDSLASGMCLARDMAPPTLANFKEVEPGGKETWTSQIFDGNPSRLWMPINGMSYSIYLLKPGSYKLAAVYENQMDTYWGGKAPNERAPVPGKVWKGEVRSNTLEFKVGGEFKPAPPSGPKPMWSAKGITPPQKGQAAFRGDAGTRAPLPPGTAAAPGPWTDLFSVESWYKQQQGEEQVFVGALHVIPPSGAASTLQRDSHYRLAGRTIYTGAKRVPALDSLAGKLVEIRGKSVNMELEGQSLHEIWPAAVRTAAPGSVPTPPLDPKSMPRHGGGAI